MPTAPARPRYLDDEEEAGSVPESPPEEQFQSAEPDIREEDLPPPPSTMQRVALRPQSLGAAGGQMDAPDPTVKSAATKIQLGQRPSNQEYKRLADRQRLETEPALQSGGEGMGGPDLQVRSAALKVQTGAKLSDQEIRRLNERQRLEQQQGGVAPDRSVSTLLAGSRLDPRGTRQEQDLAARRAQIQAIREQRTAGAAKQKEFNSEALANFKTEGKQYYTDPETGLIVPVKDETGRDLYHPTTWEDGGEHPQTKEPTLIKRDKYGQRQYKAPPIVSGADPTDSQLYYKFGDDDLRPAGSIEELKSHPNPAIAKLARRTDVSRKQAVWKQAIEPMQALAQAAATNFNQAKQREIDLQGEINDLTDKSAAFSPDAMAATQGGFMGIGTSPTPDAANLLQNKAAIDQRLAAAQDEQNAIHESLKPMGELGRINRKADLQLKEYITRSKFESYTDLVQLRREILQEQGLPEEGDRPLQALLEAEREFGRGYQSVKSVATQQALAERRVAGPPAPPAGEQPAAPSTQAPFTAFAQAAASGIGSIAKGAEVVAADMPPVDEYGRYYNAEQGADFERRQALPAAQKMQEIQQGGAYQLGQALQEAAREVYKLTPEQEKGFFTKAGSMAGGFLPLVAAGPAAPGVMALQATGDDMERIYNERVAKGASPDAAASFAINRSLLSGAVQGALFEILPKPLRAATDKLIVDKLARGTLSKLLANRVAQGAEGAALGGASHAAGSVVADRPVTEGAGGAAAGMGLMQAVMPRGGAQPKPEGKAGPEVPPAPETGPKVGPGGEVPPAPAGERPPETPVGPTTPPRTASTPEEAEAHIQELAKTEPALAELLNQSEPAASSEAPGSFTLPKELAGAKPRYSYGDKQFTLEFASDLDRAAYILAQKTPSKRDADYLKAVLDHSGMSEDEARAYGATVRSRIKPLAKAGKSGDTLTIPSAEAPPSNEPPQTPPSGQSSPVETPAASAPAAPNVPAEAPGPVAPTLGDQPVKLQVRRAKTGEMVDVEMPARKAEERINKHLSVLSKLIDCLGGK